MGIKDDVSATMDETVAMVFQMDKDQVASHHNLRFKEDLSAKSAQYFPILAAFEDQYGLLLDYHMFQFAATTVETAIDYIVDEYAAQIGEE